MSCSCYSACCQFRLKHLSLSDKPPLAVNMSQMDCGRPFGAPRIYKSGFLCLAVYRQPCLHSLHSTKLMRMPLAPGRLQPGCVRCPQQDPGHETADHYILQAAELLFPILATMTGLDSRIGEVRVFGSLPARAYACWPGFPQAIDADL